VCVCVCESGVKYLGGLVEFCYIIQKLVVNERERGCLNHEM